MNIIVALLILSVIVMIHELGHFLLAKKNGITVVEFSIGMGPRLASFVRNGTRYSLKLFPIGGSCMMLGEDEAIDDEGAFGKKGVWARFSVISAGAVFNFLLAFVLALVYLGNAGVDKPFIRDTAVGSASEGVLQEGDMITAINGSSIHLGRDIFYYFYFNPVTEKPLEITYLRDGVKNKVVLTPQWTDSYMLGCSYNNNAKPAVLEAVSEGYPLAAAGLISGDTIVNVDGTEIATGQDFGLYMKAHPMTGEPIEIIYVTKAEPEQRISVMVTPQLVNSEYSTGINYNLYHEKVSALEVVKYSFYEVKLNIVSTLKSVLYLVTGKASVKEIAGPVGIVNYVGDIVNESKDYGIGVTLLSLIQFSILISANLGVMNLLPLPALDGGRLVFLVIEAVFRKPVPKEKEALVHMIGMVLLMLLMVFVLFNDLRNIFTS
jgi:regulator of sigma E protease